MGGKLHRRMVLQAGAAALGLTSAGAQAQPGADLVELIERAAEPLPPIPSDDFAAFVDRFAGAKVILLGESSHGTDEFYRARAAITERLTSQHGFNVVAVEGDWPDAVRIDAYIRGHADMPVALTPFQRFPMWMWRNRPVRDMVDRLHAINAGIADPERKVGFYGIDLYSLPSSMDAVEDFVRRNDPEALDEVRRRYGCLSPWLDEPSVYGALANRRQVDTCADEVQSVIEEVLGARMDSIQASDRAVFDALQNARVVAASEAYYRAMYEGSVASWNLRDTHMFETLEAVLEARGPDARAVVWAHNSHIGDASATEMGRRGEINLGQLCRERYGDGAVLIGFDTATGTVTAAPDWGGRAQTMNVRPPIPGSWGEAMRGVGPDRFFLDIRHAPAELREALDTWRPERFIGVIYRPETERLSHYAGANLARQFDGYVWFEETAAVEPLPSVEIEGMPETYPFAL